MKKKKINKNILKILRNLSKNDYKFFVYIPRNFEFFKLYNWYFFLSIESKLFKKKTNDNH